MTAISVTSVTVLDNPSKATNPLQFEIQYECLFPLEDGELRRARMPSMSSACSPPAGRWAPGHARSGLGEPPQRRTVPPRADLEWKITYVGSAESEKYDQVLDTVFVGPVSPGQYRFVFQVRGRRSCGAAVTNHAVPAAEPAPLPRCTARARAPAQGSAARRSGVPAHQTPRPPACSLQADAPNFAQIPPDDVVGVTVILLTCSYKNQVCRGGGAAGWRADG